MKKSFKVGFLAALLACVVSSQAFAEGLNYYAIIECNKPSGGTFKKVVQNVNLKFAPVIHYTDMQGYEHDTTYACDVKYIKAGEVPENLEDK